MAVWGNMVENPMIWGAGWSKRHWHEGTISHEASECTKLGQWFYLSCHVRRTKFRPKSQCKIRKSKLRTKLHAFGIIVSAVIREDRISNPGGGKCTPPGPWIILDPVQQPCQMRRFAQIISPEVEVWESSKKLATPPCQINILWRQIGIPPWDAYLEHPGARKKRCGFQAAMTHQIDEDSPFSKLDLGGS
jgi:hypothetical protein